MPWFAGLQRERAPQATGEYQGLPCNPADNSAEGRNGDGFQSPQSRYFDPLIDGPDSQNDAGQSSFRLPATSLDVSSGLEAEQEQFGNSSGGFMSSGEDRFGSSAWTEGFPFAPPGATLVRLVPCVPVIFIPGRGPWGRRGPRPYMMDASPKARAFNRGMKKNSARDAQEGETQEGGSFVRKASFKGTWSAKAKSKPSASLSAAVASAAAAASKGKGHCQQGLQQQQEQLKGRQCGSESSNSKPPDKNLDPSAVYVDLSCLRPQRRVLPRFAQ